MYKNVDSVILFLFKVEEGGGDKFDAVHNALVGVFGHWLAVEGLVDQCWGCGIAGTGLVSNDLTASAARPYGLLGSCVGTAIRLVYVVYLVARGVCLEFVVGGSV